MLNSNKPRRKKDMQYMPKARPQQDSREANTAPSGEGGRPRYQQKQGTGQQRQNTNYGGRGRGDYSSRGQQRPMRGGHMGQSRQDNFQQNLPASIADVFPHQQNLQQMDQSELQELLMKVLTTYGPDLANMTSEAAGEGGAPGITELLSKLGGGQMQDSRDSYSNMPPRMHHQNRGRGGRDNYRGGRGARQYTFPHQRNTNTTSPAAAFLDFPSLTEEATASGSLGGLSSMPPPPKPEMPNPSKATSSEEDSKMQLPAMLIPDSNELMQQSLCEKHFPEPIIYMDAMRPVCKKCIAEQMDSLRSKFGSGGDPAMQNVANLLGFNNPMVSNLYQSEHKLIQRYLLKLEDNPRDMRFLHDEIKDRQVQAQENLDNLPELMCQIFAQSEKTINTHKANFLTEVTEIISKQQARFSKDNEHQVPQFYQRLSQKFNQMQEATANADQKPKAELLETLRHYMKVFLDLDAEFEKFFNEFENVSKLKRLYDKDQNEIIRDFENLVETSLRVDYNVKNSFQPGVPSRVHSFQWNQKYAYIYKIHSQAFEKRPVQMELDVPLYSRSIATEDGSIYLIGGCNKRRNQYLKKCFRYNEIFALLDEKASMIYPHADHSVCSLEGFIYVVGTFVNSQVYGFCEVYDIGKDQWKQIDSLRVARSGVALSSFQNNFIFAFGGRVDQRKIVDTIECYDISKNVWQEIAAPNCDKSEWIPGYMSLAYQVTDNEILIFGGKSAITFQIFSGVFVLDVKKMQIREKGKLVNPCSFMNTPLVFGGHLYAFGNDIYIHKYNIAEQKWSCVPKQFP